MGQLLKRLSEADYRLLAHGTAEQRRAIQQKIFAPEPQQENGSSPTQPSFLSTTNKHTPPRSLAQELEDYMHQTYRR